MIKKSSLFHWFFFVFIPLLLVILVYFDPFTRDLDRNYHYSIAASIILVFYYIFFLFTKKKGGWTDPFTFSFLFLAFFSFMGVLVYELRERYWTNDPADMEIVGWSVLVSIAVMAGTGLISEFILKEKKQQKFYTFNLDRLSLVIWAMIIIGNIASLLLYDFYSDIPLFSSNIDASRIDIRTFSSGRGTLFILQLLLVLAIPLSYLSFMKQKKHFSNFLIFVCQFIFSIVPLLFYGGRFYFLTPILLLIITHSIFIKKITFNQAAILAVIMLTGAIGFVAFRIFGSDLNLYLIERAVWADLFPEIRSFGYVAYRIQPPDIYYKLASNFFVSLFPSAFLNSININKELMLFSIGDYVASILGTSVPIRLGLLGESYLAAGIKGVGIIFLFYGSMLAIVSKWNSSFLSGDSRFFGVLVVGTISALAIPYGTNMFPTLLFSSVFATLVVLVASDLQSAAKKE